MPRRAAPPQPVDDQHGSRRWLWALLAAAGLVLAAAVQPLLVVTGMSAATASAAQACGATVAAGAGLAQPGTGAAQPAAAVPAPAARPAPQPAPGPAPTAPGGGALDPSRIAQLAADAGFTGEDVVTAVAVALAESGGRPGIDNAGMNRNGTTDYGLWQINSVHAATGFDVSRAYDPAYNAMWAHRVFSNAGASWTPWVTYDTGAYQQHLTAARQGATGVVATTTGAMASEGVPQPIPPACVPSQAVGATPVLAEGAAAAAIAFAQQQLGEPYVWGATGPDRWDCSGLVQAAWRAAGVELPRVARDQSRAVTPVPRGQLQPGDLVFYGDPVVYHVVMYLGNDRIIEAPRTGLTVRETAMRWSNFVGAGRPGAGGAGAT